MLKSRSWNPYNEQYSKRGHNIYLERRKDDVGHFSSLLSLHFVEFHLWDANFGNSYSGRCNYWRRVCSHDSKLDCLEKTRPNHCGVVSCANTRNHRMFPDILACMLFDSQKGYKIERSSALDQHNQRSRIDDHLHFVH